MINELQQVITIKSETKLTLKIILVSIQDTFS